MKNILKISLLSAILVVGIWSCKKDSTTTSDGIPADEQPQALVDSLANSVNSPTITDASTTSEISFSSYPDLLETDYFALAQVEGPMGGMTDSANKHCCSGIKLSKAQKEKLMQAFKDKEDCMAANRRIIKDIDAKILSEAADERKHILDGAKHLMDSVNALYDSGQITLLQKQDALSRIEQKRAELLQTVKLHALGKIKSNVDRLIAAGKIKDCEKIYLQSIKDILTPTQFKVWIECHKLRYRHK